MVFYIRGSRKLCFRSFKKIDAKVQSEIQSYKDMCSSIGFEPGTENLVIVLVKFLDKEKNNTNSSQKLQVKVGQNRLGKSSWRI